MHRVEGMPVRAIARRLGMGRNTVRRALAAEGPPKYVRPLKGSVVDAVERPCPDPWHVVPSQRSSCRKASKSASFSTAVIVQLESAEPSYFDEISAPRSQTGRSEQQPCRASAVPAQPDRQGSRT